MATAPAEVSDSSWLGQQLQLYVRYLINPNLLLTSCLARFFAGDMIEDDGGDDRNGSHIGLHYLVLIDAVFYTHMTLPMISSA